MIKCRQNTCRGVSSPAVMASTVLRETKAQKRHGGSSRVWCYRSTIFTRVYSDDLSQTAGTALHHTANSLPVKKRGRGLAKVLRHTRERRSSHSPVVISRHWEHCCSVFCGILLTFRHQTFLDSEVFVKMFYLGRYDNKGMTVTCLFVFIESVEGQLK